MFKLLTKIESRIKTSLRETQIRTKFRRHRSENVSLSNISLISCFNEPSRVRSLRSSVLFALSLFVASEGIKLECQYGTVDWGLWTDALYTCDDAKIIHHDTHRIVTELSQSHTEGYSNDDVMGVYVAPDKTLKFVPRILSSHFPNLIVLQVDYCGIEKISREDFAGMPKLKALSLNDNKIKVIESDLFASNPALFFIALAYNPITKVGVGVFDQHKDLKELHFYKTTCIADEYSEALASNVENMISKIARDCPLSPGK